MPASLQVLILEDNPSDAELFLHELRQAGFDPEWQRVETEEEYLAALHPALDIILSDYSLPQFDALSALRLLQARGLDLPFILISGTIGEDIAVEAMKQGADDYLLKDRLTRLGPAVKSALEQKRLRDERKLAAAELWKTESQLHTVLNNAPITIFTTDSNGIFTLSEGKGLEHVGLKPGENVGVSALDLYGSFPFVEYSGKVTNGEDVIRRVLAGEEVTAVTELRGVYFDNHIGPLRDTDGKVVGIVGVAIDITERKQAEEALRNSEARYRVLFEQSPNGVLLIDLETGKTIEANETAHRQLGYTREEFAALRISDYEVLEKPEETARRMQKIIREGSDDFETLHRAKSGEIRNMHVWVKIVQLSDRSLFYGIVQDITERKQAEEIKQRYAAELEQRVAERTADLNSVNIELERSLRVKDEFLANMSHELRTPLTGILGLSESLEEQIVGPLNEKQQKYAHNIRESGHHLLTLINDILDLAKIEAGQVALDFNKVDIRPLCESSLRMVRELAHKKHQDIGLEIDDDLVLIWADERRLKQMIINLLSNAIKFTPEGGRIGLEAHGYRDENKMTITVWDSGIGITENDLALLFQPFVQLDSGLARESAGTGLGLALVAQMAHLHGGSVSAASEPGKGSRFTISLAWEPALETETTFRGKDTGKLRAMKPGENRRTILLVEDTTEVVTAIRDYLEYAGYRVETARNGIDGIAQAKKVCPDLILMDVQMPGMDGLEAAQRLRSEAEFEHTPIIALTALALHGERERCLASGMDEYICKPVNLKAMLKLIQNFLSGDEGSKPL